MIEFLVMTGPKLEQRKKALAVHQATLGQFNLVPRPSRENALKAVRALKLGTVKARDFNPWWDRFLGGDVSLKKMELDECKFSKLISSNQFNNFQMSEASRTKTWKRMNPSKLNSLIRSKTTRQLKSRRNLPLTFIKV